MGRKKIEIRPILDDRNRQVTLNKRKAGLFKKAYELSVLCQCDVALIIFDSQGRQYQYSNDLKNVLERIVEDKQRPVESHTNETIEQWLQRLKKSGMGSEDDEPTPMPIKLEPVSVPPVVVDSDYGAKKKRPNKPQIYIPPPPADFQDRSLLRLPSLGFSFPVTTAGPLGTFDPSLLASSPGPFFGLPSFFPPPSPLNPVLHSSGAGDLIMSNSIQTQLHRQNSGGFQSMPATRQMPPVSSSVLAQASSYNRQPSTSDFFSRSDSQNDGLAAIVSAAASAMPIDTIATSQPQHNPHEPPSLTSRHSAPQPPTSFNSHFPFFHANTHLLATHAAHRLAPGFLTAATTPDPSSSQPQPQPQQQQLTAIETGPDSGIALQRKRSFDESTTKDIDNMMDPGLNVHADTSSTGDSSEDDTRVKRR